MDDALLVRGGEALADLPEEGERRSATGSFPSRLSRVREVLALDELHGHEPDALGLADVVDAQDVLVRDPAREGDLAPEALERHRAVGDVLAEELERDVAVELAVVDQVDGAHAAAAERAHDLVAGADLEPSGSTLRSVAVSCGARRWSRAAAARGAAPLNPERSAGPSRSPTRRPTRG